MTPAPVSSSMRSLAWVLFALFVGLLIAPNLSWLWNWEGVGAFPWVSAIALPALLLLALFSLLGTQLWLPCLLLVPFVLLAPLETFYIQRYQTPSTAGAFASLFASNPREIREYLGGLLVPICICVAVATVLILATVWSVWHAGLGWRHRSRKMVLAILVVTPIVVTALAWSTSKPEVLERMRTRTPTLLRESVAQGYPFGVVARLAEYRGQWLLLRDNATRVEAFRFQAHQANPPAHRQVYVLVIGESSLRDHWQLFGYPRETNPELSQAKNIVPISDMLSPWFASALAIPQLLTRRPVDKHMTSWSKPWPEACVLRAMDEAGFETWWVSNQLPLGRFDSAVSECITEARHQEFLNHVSWDSPGEYDEDLLEPLRKALQSPARNLFIVLHMMGSHIAYNFRYPPSFKRFQPIISNAERGLPDADHIINSYDNTILYTDHVLTQIIAALHDSGEISAMWFQSDHGELMPTDTCDKSGRGMGTRYEYQIPALFWFSDAYSSAYPDRIATLRENAPKRTLSTDTFESLIDMAGVTFPGHDKTHSLFSSAWSYRPRFVSSQGMSDYDQARFANKCEVVIPGK